MHGAEDGHWLWRYTINPAALWLIDTREDLEHLPTLSAEEQAAIPSASMPSGRALAKGRASPSMEIIDN